MKADKNQIVFWLSMLVAQGAAFIIFKDLADISQWLVQSSRDFTMAVWYNRHIVSVIGVASLILSIFLWRRQTSICATGLLIFLVGLFVFNFYSGMINPRWMFRSQQHEATFVPVDKAESMMQKSLGWAHFGPQSYKSVDDISVIVLETDNGAYAYSDYYLLQPHVARGDTIDGEEVIMTYCGLTNLGVAYSPVIDGQELDLTVMTQLKNNLVLFDKNSGEPIQQIWGTAERAWDGHKMKEWPTVRMPFLSFKALYPDGKVFINEIVDFSDNPFLATWDRIVRHGMMLWGVGLNWEEGEKPAFPTIEFTDRRLPMKELVYTISLDSDHVAYTKDFILEQGSLINTTIGGRRVIIKYSSAYDSVVAFFNPMDESIKTVDMFGYLPDGSKLERVNTLKSRLFWFVFIEFYPGADVNRV
jgi:hypothetical protein